MKKNKKEGCQIMAFYGGGAKFHASVTHTKTEVEEMLWSAFVDGKKAVKLDTVNEDPGIKDDCLIFTLDRMLFCTILERNDSGLIVAQTPLSVQ